ncbi:MAG: glycosyl hydrolase family 79 C-terminal domain-containing protein [Solirubrobacteraceae bacterium]
MAAAHRYSARVSVRTTTHGQPVAAGFVGLALEYSTVPQWTGIGTGAGNPLLDQLVRNLDPVGRPVLRIGGQSTDHSWWPVPGMNRPPGVIYSLNDTWTRSARALAQSLDARLLLGVNLAADNVRLAHVEADRLLAGIGRRWIAALQIGNEPPLYSVVPWYRVLGARVLAWHAKQGQPHFSRGPGWGPSAFAGEYARMLKAMPRVPIAGPDTADSAWFPAFTRFLSPRSRVRMLASHAYGLNNCVTQPDAAAYPSVAHLLSPYATENLISPLRRFVALAHRDRAGYRIDEMGSITCNGRWGVSNTMASALWTAAALFTAAQAGVDGVNLHAYPGLSNTPFDLFRSKAGWVGVVRPMYYGALLFSQAAPAGSRVLKIGVAGPPTLRAWATAGPGPVVRVTLINDSITDPVTAVVRAPAGFDSSPAQSLRLSAPSAYARTGITLGGASFGSRTKSGVLSAPVPASVAPRLEAFHVTLPRASALLLTFTRASRG